MLPAEKAMGEFFKSISFNTIETPVVQNVTAGPVTDSHDLMVNLTKQVSSCVKWTTSVDEMIKMGSLNFIECGAGKVLTGLGRKINADRSVFSTSTMDELQNVIQVLKALNH